MTRPVRILLLEDSQEDAELLRRELTRGGLEFSVVRVATEVAFRQTLATELVDVILADYSLPSFNGIRALEIAHATVPEIPFIFVSGSIGEERALEALRHGATDYILKDRMSRLPTAVARARAEVEERRLRREAQDALRRSQERFLLAAQATQDVIWDLDVRADSIWFDASLKNEWGHDVAAGETNIEWWRQQVHPDDQENASANLQQSIHGTATNFQLEYRFRRADGRYGHVLDRATVLRDADGKAVRVIGAMQDITARIDAERQLEQEQRISGLGRVAAIIAHEFNNVLMGIQPYAELMKRRSEDDPVRMRAAEGILSAVGRGSQITRDILRAANPGEPSLETFDITRKVEAIASEIRGMMPRPIRVILEAPSTPQFVRCDPGQLQQVLVNLSVNARDAMNGRGTLRFTVAAEGRSATISVTDSGKGIPPDVLPKIFDLLFTTKPNGTGLGLALARQMLIRNHGTIAVRSIVGEGTTFTIRFPEIEALNGPERVPPQPTVERLHLRRLLIIDDDEAVVHGMTELLATEGFVVRSAGRAAEVAAEMEAFEPEAVILDLNLENGDGMDVYRMLAAARPDLPVIIASGRIERNPAVEAALSQHVAFLRKPYDLEMLLDSLRKIA